MILKDSEITIFSVEADMHLFRACRMILLTNPPQDVENRLGMV